MKKLALLTLLLSSLTSSAVAQPQTSALTFETQGLDLETGLVLELGDPDVDASAVDLHIAANADRTTQAVVFQAAGAELARMGGTHFEYVSPSDIGSLIFTLEPVDQPCGAGDTVMIRTVGGSVYKIGNFLEDEASGAVLFDYELLEGPQAALPPRMETEAPARMAARPAGKVSLLGAEARQAIAQFVERDRYGIRRTGAAWLASGTLEASNPAQAYTTRFTPGGVVVVPKGPRDGVRACAYRLGLRDGASVRDARGAARRGSKGRVCPRPAGRVVRQPEYGARAGVHLERCANRGERPCSPAD